MQALKQDTSHLRLVEDTDEELMDAINDGDQHAFSKLVDRHNKLAFACAMKIVNFHRETAEDVVQKVFIKIWQKPDSFNPDKAKFTTWLYRVVTNQALDEKRKRSFSALPEDYDVTDPSETAEDTMVAASETAQIKQAIAKLSDKMQVAMTLTYFEERSNAETAAIMEISVKALESLLVRGRRQLKQLLNVRQ